MKLIDTQVISVIANKTQTAKAFFEYASRRERNVREGVSRIPSLRVQMAKKGFLPVTSDLMSLFRDLDEAGFGKLHGKQFKWNIAITDIAAEMERAPVQAPQAVPQLPKTMKTLVVCFEGDKEIKMSFSPGLTRRDIDLVVQKVLTELE